MQFYKNGVSGELKLYLPISLLNEILKCNFTNVSEFVSAIFHHSGKSNCQKNKAAIGLSQERCHPIVPSFLTTHPCGVLLRQLVAGFKARGKKDWIGLLLSASKCVA